MITAPVSGLFQANCDACSNAYQGPAQATIGLFAQDAFEAILRSSGWKLEGDRVLCPECAQRCER